MLSNPSGSVLVVQVLSGFTGNPRGKASPSEENHRQHWDVWGYRYPCTLSKCVPTSVLLPRKSPGIKVLLKMCYFLPFSSPNSNADLGIFKWSPFLLSPFVQQINCLPAFHFSFCVCSALRPGIIKAHFKLFWTAIFTFCNKYRRNGFAWLTDWLKETLQVLICSSVTSS